VVNRHLDEHFFEADLPWFRTVADAVANNYCQFSSVVEQRFCKPSVVGSNPTTGSISNFKHKTAFHLSKNVTGRSASRTLWTAKPGAVTIAKVRIGNFIWIY
jgi:hypothetical protein